MSTDEMLFEKAKSLPENPQAEAFHYFDFHFGPPRRRKRGQGLSQLSAAQLSRQYSPEDTTSKA